MGGADRKVVRQSGKYCSWGNVMMRGRGKLAHGHEHGVTTLHLMPFSTPTPSTLSHTCWLLPTVPLPEVSPSKPSLLTSSRPYLPQNTSLSHTFLAPSLSSYQVPLLKFPPCSHCRSPVTLPTSSLRLPSPSTHPRGL